MSNRAFLIIVSLRCGGSSDGEAVVFSLKSSGCRRLETLFTAISDIPEGCILFGLLIARLFIFSDRLLNILLAMYLVSNKVASN